MTKTSVHAAMITATALEFCGLFILAVTPETLNRTTGTERQPTENSICSVQPAASPDEPISVRTTQMTSRWTKDQFDRIRDRLLQPARLLWADKTIFLGLPVFLTTPLLRQVVSLLLQYASKKLNWTIAAVSCHLLFNKIPFQLPSHSFLRVIVTCLR